LSFDSQLEELPLNAIVLKSPNSTPMVWCVWETDSLFSFQLHPDQLEMVVQSEDVCFSSQLSSPMV
jgi:hypothetical protein